MLPASTGDRKQRDISKGKQDGRGVEIQRLIGRSLRVVVDFRAMGERSVYVDCDVLEADGGTRCAAITGGYVALRQAFQKLVDKKALDALPLTGSVAAVSVGIVNGRALCDLDYGEDSNAEVDANVVMTGDGGLVEVQATAERTPLSRASLDELLGLAEMGIGRLREVQERALRDRGTALILATRNQHKLAEMSELLPGVDLRAAARGGGAAAGDGRQLRGQRADQGARRPRRHRRGDDRRRLRDRSRRPRRRARHLLRPLRRRRRQRRDNLAKLLREVDAAGGERRAAYVCAIALIDEDGHEYVFEARCEGTLLREGRGERRLRLRPGLRPRRDRPQRPADDVRAEPGGEERDQPPRQGGADAGRATSAWRPEAAPMIRSKSGAAALSIASNSILIALKLAAGAITGSIAILTEAIHSLIDLVASVIAFVSVRKADEPADEEHPYGHEKVENLAATIEGILILVGAAVIVYEATHRLVVGSAVESARRRHRRDGVLGRRQPGRLRPSSTRQARAHESPALEGDAAHLRTDALTSAGVLVGLALVQITGVAAFDSITALIVAAAIVWAGLSIIRRSSGVLVDEALPDAEMDRIEAAIAAARTPEVAGYHKLRARRAGRRRHIDLHVQYRSGTSLERAHELAHEMRDSIEAEIPQAEVLIHAEPETSLPRARRGPVPLGLERGCRYGRMARERRATAAAAG